MFSKGMRSDLASSGPTMRATLSTRDAAAFRTNVLGSSSSIRRNSRSLDGSGASRSRGRGGDGLDSGRSRVFLPPAALLSDACCGDFARARDRGELEKTAASGLVRPFEGLEDILGLWLGLLSRSEPDEPDRRRGEPRAVPRRRSSISSLRMRVLRAVRAAFLLGS